MVPGAIGSAMGVALEADFFFGADFLLEADFLALFAAFFFGAAFLFMPPLRAEAFFLLVGLLLLAIFFLRGLDAFLFALFFAKLPPPFVPKSGAGRVTLGKPEGIIEHSRGQTASESAAAPASMTIRWILAIVATCALFPVLGCRNPCLEGKGKTEKALREAREAQAQTLAPEPLARSIEIAGRSERECGIQASRWPFFRSYRRAEELWGEALREAEAAREQSHARGGFLRQEALNSRYTAGMTVNDAVIALGRVKEMKGDARAKALAGRLDALRLALADLQREIDAGKYVEARELGEKIHAEALRLQADANTRALSPGSR
jgi:hypothetical protein